MAALTTDAISRTTSYLDERGEQPLSVHVEQRGDDCGGYVLPLDPTRLPVVPSVESGLRDSWANAHGGIRPDSHVEITVQGTSADAVVLTGLTVDIQARRPPMRGIHLAESCGDLFAVRWMTVDLDAEPVEVTESVDQRYLVEDPPPGEPSDEPIAFPYRVTNSEPEIFSLLAVTEECYCLWTATLEWRADGVDGRTVISDNGKPFAVTATSGAPRYSAYGGGVPQSASGEDSPDTAPVSSSGASDPPLGEGARDIWLAHVTPQQCYDAETPMVINQLRTGDLTGDGRDEVFVASACQASTSSWPEQLEAFSVSATGVPTRLGTLYSTSDPDSDRGLRLDSLSIEEGVVTMTTTGWTPSAGSCCPDLQIEQTFRLEDGDLVPQPRVVSPKPG